MEGHMKKRIALALVVLLLGGPALAQAARIGVNLELSGRLAALGVPALEGIEVARAQLDDPDAYQLSVCDNASSVENSVACANRFVDEGVVAVLGPCCTSMAIPAAEVLQAAGIPMISTSSTNPATTEIGDYIFRMAYRDDFQGVVAARYAFDDLGARTAIIFRQQDDDYSFGLAGFFSEEFESLGGETIVVDFVANTVDFSAQISDILGVPADMIYYSGFCAEGASLVPALRSAGLTQQMVGADASDDAQCPLGGGSAFDGYIFTGFAGPDILAGEAAGRAEAFVTSFREQYPADTDINGFTLAGADSMTIIAEALRAAGTTMDRVAVRDALAAIEGFPGVSGEITYAGTDGTPLDRIIGFYQYQVPAPDGSAWASEALFGIATGD
jgi:branched-chain amino acid transport system substrate-binding protein